MRQCRFICRNKRAPLGGGGMLIMGQSVHMWGQGSNPKWTKTGWLHSRAQWLAEELV